MLNDCTALEAGTASGHWLWFHLHEKRFNELVVDGSNTKTINILPHYFLQDIPGALPPQGEP